MTTSLVDLAAGRFARAAEYADARGLRFVVRDAGVQARDPVAVHLHAFAQAELDHVLNLVMDCHAALVSQLMEGPNGRTVARAEALLVVANRVQALVGQLELARADE